MKKLSKRKKIILLTITILTIVLVIVGFVLASKYKNIIERELPKRVANATHGLYSIEVKKIGINLLSRSITLKDVHIWHNEDVYKEKILDSTAPLNTYDITIPRLNINSIMKDDLVGGSGLSANILSIEGANVEVRRHNNIVIHKKREAERSQDIFISTIALTNAKFIYYPDAFNNGKWLTFSNTSIKLEDWSLMNITDSSSFLMSSNGRIHCDTFTMFDKHSDYTYKALNLSFNSNTRNLTATDFSIMLNKPQNMFFQKHKMQKEIYSVSLPTLEINDINWEKLFYKKQLHASTIYLNNSKIKVFFSRLLPVNNASKLGKYPNQILQKLKLPIYVKKVKLNKGSVTYSELSDKTNKEASIHFTNVDANVDNVTNIKQFVDSNNTCLAKLSGKFNHFSPIHATFKFRLDDKLGGFSVNGLLEHLQQHQIDKQAQTFTLIAISSLNMKKMSFNLEGNEKYAKGSFKMLYKNLKIKILKNQNDSAARNNKGFLTFIANNMILNSHNPMPGRKVRIVSTYIKREPTRSFFNLIWQNIHQGVQETMIRDMNVIRWIRRNEKELGKRKRREKRKRSR